MKLKVKPIKAIVAALILLGLVFYGVYMQTSTNQSDEEASGDRVITIGGTPTSYPMLYVEGVEVKGSTIHSRSGLFRKNAQEKVSQILTSFQLHGSLGYETPIGIRNLRLAERILDNEHGCGSVA